MIKTSGLFIDLFIYRTKSLGPLEIAYKRNQLLMAAYKARQAKLNARNAFDLVQFAEERYFTDYMYKVYV